MHDSLTGKSEDAKPKLLAEVRRVLRFKHYSLRTEQAYVDWIKRFVRHHGTRHPREMAAAEVRAFLSHLATERDVAASTQNQALSALLFLYKEVLGVELGWLGEVERARRPQRLPVVLSREEARRLLAAMSGQYRLMAELLYGTGLRLMECLRLRIKDLDFEYLQITVREGKGGKDRVTMLPVSVVPALREHLEGVQARHERDLGEGYGEVWLPGALERKYTGAPREWGCSPVNQPPLFPSSSSMGVSGRAPIARSASRG